MKPFNLKSAIQENKLQSVLGLQLFNFPLIGLFYKWQILTDSWIFYIVLDYCLLWSTLFTNNIFCLTFQKDFTKIKMEISLLLFQKLLFQCGVTSCTYIIHFGTRCTILWIYIFLVIVLLLHVIFQINIIIREKG